MGSNVVRLKRESKELKKRAVSGVILAIEFFNRPSEHGRADAVLMFLHYAFEMLLKAAIMQERGTIHDKDSANSYPFRKCLGISKSDILIISDTESRFLGALSDLRDCSMHHYQILSEDLLYQQVQRGVLLFDELLHRIFSERLADSLPSRVLPVSIRPPMNVRVLMDKEYSSIRDMLKPGMRRRAEAAARVRPLLILEANLLREGGQPATREVSEAISTIVAQDDWSSAFPGMGSLTIAPSGSGTPYSIRMTKNEGLGVHKFTDEEALEGIFGYREMDYRSKWPFNETELIRRTGIGQHDLRAMIYFMNVKDDDELYKEFKIDSYLFKHYSSKAVDLLKQARCTIDLDEARQRYRSRPGRSRQPIISEATT
ncbi:MAG: DUF3644 domain-containing protein [Thermomicrobiales bacterium]